MRVYIVLALCMWRDDWPPDSDDVRMALFRSYNALVDFTAPFICQHPREMPWQLECGTLVNMTHTQCLRFKSDLSKVPPDTIKVSAPDDSRGAFSLCSVALHCNARPPRVDAAHEPT